MRHPAFRFGFALVALIAFVWLARFAPGAERATGELTDALGLEFDAPDEGLMATGSSLGLLLLGGWLAGRVAAAFGIAKVTGYLLLGIAIGPSALGVIGEKEVGYLTLINDLAVSLIALTAGGEIRLSFLRESWRQVVFIALGVMGAVWVAIFGLMLFALPAIGMTEDSFGTVAIAIAAIVATISTSNSPAIVIALIAELRSRGPMTKLALSVTVCKDMFLVVVFSIVLALGATAIERLDPPPEQPSAQTQDESQVATEIEGAVPATSPSTDPPPAAPAPESARGIAIPLLQHLLGSVLVGAVIGILMASYMHWVRAHAAIFIILTCFGIALLSEALHLEALLVAVTAGMLMENAFEETSEALFESVEDLSLPVYCVFFAVAGLRVDLAAVSQMWHWALIAVAARGAAVYCGTRVGAAMSGLEDAGARRWLWTAFIPQAGVSVALATIIRDTFAAREFGPALFNFMMAMIAAHELIGPILMKIGLVKAGEVGEDRK